MNDVDATEPTETELHELQDKPFSFSGTGSEYFGIWIVNILLSIVTIGIYSAWAKVRTTRYFYGNTWVDDHSFEYHANPIAILKGRIIAVGVLVLLQIPIPFIQIPLLIAIFFAVPWIINRSLRFTARNSSYRNVRFDFQSTYGQAFIALILWPIAGFLSLGLLMPVASRASRAFIVNNHRFGDRPLNADLPLGRFYFIYLEALLLLIGLGLIGSVIGAALLSGVELTEETQVGDLPISLFAGQFLVFFAIIVIPVYVATRLTNLVLTNAILDGRHRFRSAMSPWSVVWITVTNVVAVVFTLGLLVPWAAIRLAKYRASKTTLRSAGNLDDYTSKVASDSGALGDQLGDILDIDVSI